MENNNNQEERKILISKHDPNIKQARKAYNEDYYKDNKQILQLKYKQRVCCPLCNKSLSKARLSGHIKDRICIRKKERLEELMKNA